LPTHKQTLKKLKEPNSLLTLLVINFKRNSTFALQGQVNNLQVILGQRLRELREEKGMLLREVAAKLEIDTAMISKIERGEKTCKREHISKLSTILNIDEKELIVLWLSEYIYPILKNEEFAIEALDRTKKRLKL